MSNLESKSHDLFTKAVELSSSEWPAFLADNCDSDELRTKVQRLLDLHARSEDFLLKSAAATYPHLVSPYGEHIEEFKLIRQIGKGGMGIVYLAEDTKLKRPVALKVVTHSTSDHAVFDRFQREARTAAGLNNHGIVKVYRNGEGNGFSFIAMEFVDGKTLQEHFDNSKKQHKGNDSARFTEIARLVSEVADSLDFAHRASVIHRDVKPSNILIDANGRARLTDFGIARITTEQTLLHTGDIIGSLHYMSPEQAKVCKNEVDHRTDIFSLGVVLYEAISTKRPFEGLTQHEIFNALAEGRPVSVRKVCPPVPLDLATICHKAIENDLSHRYQTAAHMSADLRCFIECRPILARPPSLARRIRCWAGNHQRVFLAACILLLALALTVVSFAYMSAKQAGMGQLVVTEKHRGASVTATRYSDDLILETPQELGRAPLSVYLIPSLYSVTINDGVEELRTTSLIDAGAVDTIEMNSPDPAVISSLVLIPGGKYELGKAGSTYNLNRVRLVELSSFRISATSVSNREYNEYIQATKARSPAIWSTPYDRTIDDLPVTDITWDEANLYCRWRGAKLPTPDEWEASAKGPNGSAFPWGTSFSPDIQRRDSEDFDANTYRRLVRPVRSDPHLATPLGVMHMLSNIQEYTEGIATNRNRGIVLKGRSWSDSPFHRPAELIVLSSRSVHSINRGFRISIRERSVR